MVKEQRVLSVFLVAKPGDLHEAVSERAEIK